MQREASLAKNLSEELKRMRLAAGLTQKQLSDKVGYTQVTLSQYETGNRIPSRDAIEDIALFYKVKAEKLMKMLPNKFRALVMRELEGKTEEYLEQLYYALKQ